MYSSFEVRSAVGGDVGIGEETFIGCVLESGYEFFVESELDVRVVGEELHAEEG